MRLHTKQNNREESYIETELGTIPTDWDICTIESVTDVKGGKRLPKGHGFSKQPTEFPYLRVVDFSNWSINRSDLKYLSPEDAETLKRYIISSEDVYISIAGTIGTVGTIPEELNGSNLTENAAKVIIKDKNRLDKYYLVAYLASPPGQHEIDIRTTKTSQPKLALARIKSIPIPIPSISEQKKIAHVLLTIQVAKEKTENSIKAFMEFKKTLMKHLFSYGPISLEEAEKLRFKETEIGEIPEDWEVKELRNVATLQRGKDLPKQNWVKGIVPIVGSSGVMGYHNLSVCKGPGVVTGRSGSIGKVTYIEKDYWPHNTALYVKDFHENHPKYIYYRLQTLDFKKYATGVSVPTLNRNSIHMAKLAIPSLSVQKNTASILSTADEKIEKLENKRKALDELFKSMLHDLMTAKIRVNHLEVESG